MTKLINLLERELCQMIKSFLSLNRYVAASPKWYFASVCLQVDHNHLSSVYENLKLINLHYSNLKINDCKLII